MTSRATLSETRQVPIFVDGEVYRSPDEYPEVRYEMVSANHFNTLDTVILKGRSFEGTDVADSLPVAVINTSFNTTFWPGKDPIGKRFRAMEEGGPWLTVVGVVPDLWMQGLYNFEENGAGFYRPISQSIDNTMSLVVRSKVRDFRWAQTFRMALAALDSTQAAKDVGTFEDEIEAFFVSPRVVAGAFTIFGSIAVLLAMLGVYSILSFSISRRKREFGIRLALGALRTQLVRMVVRQSAKQMILGLLLGTGLSLILSRAMLRAELLSGVSLFDPITYITVTFLVAAVALFSVLVPAGRASKVHPMEAFREE